MLANLLTLRHNSQANVSLQYKKYISKTTNLKLLVCNLIQHKTFTVPTRFNAALKGAASLCCSSSFSSCLVGLPAG